MTELTIQAIAKLLGLNDPLDEDIVIAVQPIVHGRFGVFANAELISIHETQDDAKAQVRRPCNQKVEG